MKWHEMEMNAFVHFSINTFTDKEWGYGDESPSLFNPTQMNAEQWTDLFRKVGFKGLILTSKHHDGFCLWPSSLTNHSIKRSNYKNGNGDIVKEVSDACRKHGIKFGIYLSPWDRNHRQYGQPEYVEYYRGQLKELFTKYGPVFEMWFDGANGGDGFYGGARETRRIDGKTYYDWPRTLSMVREFEPKVIFFSDAGPDVRWCGNEKGIAGITNWNTITPDTLYAGKPHIEKLLNEGSENGTRWIPSEVDVSIRPGWFYHQKEDSLVKTPEKLFEIYLSSVGRGSTLLLNIPPDRRGLIHEADQHALTNFRKILNRSFANNLAKGGNVEASSVRGKSKGFAAAKAIDGNKETYWSLDDDVTTGWISVSLKNRSTVTFVLIQEYIKLGQRVKEFSVEVFDGKNWKSVADGTTIGYKRIVRIEPTSAEKVRLNIKSSKACPLISNMEVY
jgi:alpha-L-fucosidase